MGLKRIKNWKTTISAIIGGVLMMAGIFWPDVIDTDTSEVIKSATNEIMVGIGGLITVITGLLAKD